ncbi:MAG: hypothetical protein WC897_04575, partial [Candidatus Gracilibacteria bacterium]
MPKEPASPTIEAEETPRKSFWERWFGKRKEEEHESRDIGKNGLLFFFYFGLGKLLNAVYLFIFGSMFKKRLVDAVLG